MGMIPYEKKKKKDSDVATITFFISITMFCGVDSIYVEYSTCLV